MSAVADHPRRADRVSRLAVASVPASLLGNPFIVGDLRRWIAEYLPQSFQQTGEHGYIHWWFIVGCMSVSSLMPLVALSREWLAGRRGLGLALAAGGFVVSLLWWGLLAFIFLAIAPGD
ncbi:MAG TPA: hypothetical protein VFG68_16685 [Fimbriiglobus sp.]|nr:hypothetical protein [Fimbriiglobus sp.]